MTINYQPSKINISTASAQAEISNLWHIKGHHSKCVLELRAIKPNCEVIRKIFKGKNFVSTDALKLAFEAEALRLNDAGYNTYYVMNPIREDFEGGSATDKDITYRDLLLIDIDKIGHKGESSTDE
jgi:hypothetical protein